MLLLNPKSEYRNPKQILNLNFPNSKPVLFGKLEFRILDLFRISDFVLRNLLPCFVLTLLLSGCQKPKLYSDNRLLMGTYVEVISPAKEAGEIVFQEIARIENLLSKYIPESEVSRLNKSGSLKLNPETFYVLRKSEEFCRLTNGAFDITVGPLMGLWGFTDGKFRQPSEEEIKNTLGFTGCGKIILRPTDNSAEFAAPGVKIDLGGIGKGYALDCAVRKLKERGITNCLINAGGQISALGGRFGKPWKVAVKNPRARGVRGFLKLNDRSVSTSGDYEQYFTRGEQRFAHILDPRTGRPARSGIISVTVVAGDGLTADALSTSIFVLGRQKGELLAKQFPGTQVIIAEGK